MVKTRKERIGMFYHFHAKIISRGKGASCTAHAAYQSAERLVDGYDGRICDYTRKERVLDSGIFAPSEAPAWAKDRQELWNKVNSAEKSPKAQTARTFDIALPDEFTNEQNKALITDFIQNTLVSRGMIVDWAMHESRNLKNGHKNKHVHLQAPLRSLLKNGEFAPKCARRAYVGKDGKEHIGRQNFNDWNSREALRAIRKEWAECCNRHLALAGSEERIDHRTLKEQLDEALENGEYEKAIELDREPTRHEGYAARAMEKRGEKSDRCEENRQIKARNEARSKVIRQKYAILSKSKNPPKNPQTTQAPTESAWHKAQKPSQFFKGCVHPAMQMARENLRKHYPNTCSRLSNRELSRVARLFRFERDEQGKAVPIPPPREMEGSLGIDKDWNLLTEFEKEELETKAMLRDI